MLDFLDISVEYTKTGHTIKPEFKVQPSKDLMIRGSDFYAIWNESTGLWETSEYMAIAMIDSALAEYKNSHPQYEDANVQYLRQSSNRAIARWHNYVKKDLTDNYTNLDERLIFADEVTRREDYASKKLPYALSKGRHDAWDELLSVLYSDTERHKIEWSIGAIVSGDSRTLQKFLVFYGSHGTGKSTIIKIIEKLFAGYTCTFDAQAIGRRDTQFALEPFKNNPIVAIQQDGDLSKIEDNSRLNSLVSHETLTVNEKYKSTYPSKFRAFLIIGTNRPVKITDAKSGLLRRLIDVTPTGKTIDGERYFELLDHIEFELGAIAYHCLQVYNASKHAYDAYQPTLMLNATNSFYNFMVEYFDKFKEEDGTTLKEAWARYQVYCTEAKVPFPMSQMAFKEELRNYFYEFTDRGYSDEGKRKWNVFSGFRLDKFETPDYTPDKKPPKSKQWLMLEEREALIDKVYADCPAQYAGEDDKPTKKWDYVKTTLRDLDTTRVHYVRIPENHIVIDFDLKDETGNKSLPLNIKAASKFPPTYAEVSKSGSGIHLHYIYDGDVTTLCKDFGDGIEIKVFIGKSSLRRKTSKSNYYPIEHISSGLPVVKEKKKMISEKRIRTETKLREMIIANLNKQYCHHTAPSINFIYKILDDAYNDGLKYDVRDMEHDLLDFASKSSNQSDHCIKMVRKMKLHSIDIEEEKVPEAYSDDTIVFWDVEVFKNLFVLCWKYLGADTIIGWTNPSKELVTEFAKHKIVGFNNLKYDNPITFARMMGFTNFELYTLSQALINNQRSFQSIVSASKNLSYTDIFDFSSEKKSLKKFEIEYGAPHKELGLKWDEEVPEELWDTVVEYCKNDVKATEIVWVKRQGDFKAREILAGLTGLTVNDTTNTQTTKLIFGDDRAPQSQFNYVNLAGTGMGDSVEHISQIISPKTGKVYDVDPEFTCRDETGQMIFPGYRFEITKVGNKFVPLSTYRGIEVGEGGLVIANVGMYRNVTTKDVTSMHPHSIIAMNMFGDLYTKRFADLVLARVMIKHCLHTGDFSPVKDIYDGKLLPYLTDKSSAKMLVLALKIAINSVYGLTAAKFDNPFHDTRNVDNIVAKRGALFMVNLMKEVEKRGGKVVHIKTDSIKIENMSEELEDFIDAYGELYGYSFETEHVFDKICLVNDAVYIGKLADNDPDILDGSNERWEATGKQFAVPYVFKSLFSHEEIVFEDMCETMSVTSALYLDMNEGLPDVSNFEKQYQKLLKTDPESPELENLKSKIAAGHNYIFVGKTGQFCPVMPGKGGGVLCREDTNTGKMASATGAKGYRWAESQVLKANNKTDVIDRSYYDKLVDGAIKTMQQFCDVNEFLE